MAEIYLPSDASSDKPTRRQVLKQAPAAALAVAGAVVLPDGAVIGAAELPDVDLHLAWWPEYQEVLRRGRRLTKTTMP